MEGEQLPKATMANFVKKTIHQDFSPQYVQKLMDLAKEFIARVSSKSLDICTQKGKKNITVEHLQQALKKYGMSKYIDELKQLGNEIKIDNANKKEAIKQQEENIRKQLLQQRERQQQQRKVLQLDGTIIRQTFTQINKMLEDTPEQQQDYEQMQTLQETDC